MDGGDEGICLGGGSFSHIEFGSNGQYLTTTPLSEPQGAEILEGDGGNTQIVFLVENTYEGITHGRTKVYVRGAPTSYATLAWQDLIFFNSDD
jgi:hypothetical protein